MRKNDYSDPHLGAWRAYYKALVDAGVYVAGDPLEVPETGTTVRLREGKRRVQDGPYADTKEQLAGFIILELPSVGRSSGQTASVFSFSLLDASLLGFSAPVRMTGENGSIRQTLGNLQELQAESKFYAVLSG